MTSPPRDPAEYLMALPKFGSGIGLHRVLEVTRTLLSTPWWAGVAPINVVGSNGKGSVTAITSALLNALGVRTGRFTSPHLHHFSERIQVDGRDIDPGSLAALTDWLDERQEAYRAQAPDEHLGAFEAFTAVALAHFHRSAVEAIVWEAGVGGRYDATRVVAGELAALTSLDLEHTALLGDTLEAIAYDKLDVVGDGATVVVGRMPSSLLRRLRGYAAVRRMDLLSIEEHCRWTSPTHDDQGRMHLSMEVEGLDFGELCFALPGEHQASNLAVGLLVLKRWVERHRPQLAGEPLVQAAARALPSLDWPGRLMVVHDDPRVTIDVGHTPDAARVVAHAVRALARRPVLLVAGASEGKQVEQIVAALSTCAQAVVCARAHKNGAPTARGRRGLEGCGFLGPVWEHDRIEDAVAFALDHARAHGMEILLAGSLYLAVEGILCLQGRDPRNTAFY